MILGIYAIRDRKSGAYDPALHLFRTADMAKRWFYQVIHDAKDHEPNAAIVAFAEDFELWYIGSFDLELGMVVSDATSEQLVSVASDLLEV